MFPSTSFRKKRLITPALTERLRIGIGVGTTIRQQTVLEEVPAVYRVSRLSCQSPDSYSGVVFESMRRTAPMRCYPAACQLGRCEGGRSV
jgi:hypothetical protein